MGAYCSLCEVSFVWVIHAVRATRVLCTAKFGSKPTCERTNHFKLSSYILVTPAPHTRNLQDGYFESVTLDCSPCLGTPATTFGVSIAVVVVLILLLILLHRFVWRKMNKRGRRRTRATLKIVFVFAQVQKCSID